MDPQHELAKIFTGVLYHFSTIGKTSMTGDITDWPHTKKIRSCATDSHSGKNWKHRLFRLRSPTVNSNNLRSV